VNGLSGAKVCFKRLVFQSIPLILFTWDGWWQEMKCTFVGPSSIFQRWNFQVRHNYGLLLSNSSTPHPTDEMFQVLLIIRKADRGSGSMYRSRVFQNEQALIDSLSTIPGIVFTAQDFATLTFEDQVKLISRSSVLIGIHGITKINLNILLR
jgi:hypothetical protein